MELSYRNDAIAKNKLLFKLTLLWALTVTAAVIVLAAACLYAILHRQVHFLPICTGAEFSVGDRSYSPSYLRQMTEKVADLRLTYNRETIDGRYETLLHLVKSRQREPLKKLLDKEIEAVHEKHISSVFYVESIAVDVVHSQARIKGMLDRTSHDLALESRHKSYQLQFAYSNGSLELESIKEINDEK